MREPRRWGFSVSRSEYFQVSVINSMWSMILDKQQVLCPVPMELDLRQGADLRGSDSVAMAGRGCVPF